VSILEIGCEISESKPFLMTRMPTLVRLTHELIDSSQAMDVGTLKNLQADTIRVLVWILSFMTFGYATGEFEVTADRLGVYRPEEHIE
jgi:hypothetical protein